MPLFAVPCVHPCTFPLLPRCARPLPGGGHSASPACINLGIRKSPPPNMVCERSRAASFATPEIVSMASNTGGNQRAPAGDEYERLRDERIRENLDRLNKLGIVDLALKLRSERARATPSTKRPYCRTDGDKPSPPLPPRRSPRLQNVPSVKYSEGRTKKVKGKRRRDENVTVVVEEVVKGEVYTEEKRRRDEHVAVVVEEVVEDEVYTEEKRPRDEHVAVVVEEVVEDEVYTEEHDKLLGRCEEEWVLCVDGYGNDGRRIYDEVNGKTCHQCRQKTLGHRTKCSKCNLVKGQFCGDCLFMRYGENVLEAKRNPDWVCPVCRGICNCSLCRVKKGWAPTGPLYKKIRELGFQSVAHYLIQTKHEKAMEELRTLLHSARRSLTFKDDE